VAAREGLIERPRFTLDEWLAAAAIFASKAARE
jgi:hypothetical protein